MKKVLDALTGWPALIVANLLIAAFSWPIATPYVSGFWILVGISVGVGELISKLKTGNTITQNIRKGHGTHPVWFFLVIITWLVFSVQLALHFLKPLWS